jgi:hypothetical protein
MEWIEKLAALRRMAKELPLPGGNVDDFATVLDAFGLGPCPTFELENFVGRVRALLALGHALPAAGSRCPSREWWGAVPWPEVPESHPLTTGGIAQQRYGARRSAGGGVEVVTL